MSVSLHFSIALSNMLNRRSWSAIFRKDLIVSVHGHKHHISTYFTIFIFIFLCVLIFKKRGGERFWYFKLNLHWGIHLRICGRHFGWLSIQARQIHNDTNTNFSLFPVVYFFLCSNFSHLSYQNFTGDFWRFRYILNCVNQHTWNTSGRLVQF